MLSAVLVIVMLGNPAEAQRAELAKARAAYNQQQFDEAIAAALAAQKVGATADAATVVLARSYLERYRQRANPTDLAAARAQLGTVRVDNLDSRDHVDFIMALGEALFFEDDFGAAAAMFESGVDSALAQGAATGEAMLDWWGSAIERQAEGLDRGEREVMFARMRDRMTKELARNPGSAGAAYWSVVAARGAGDAVGAWDAAIAAWVRARLAGSRSAQLRADSHEACLRRWRSKLGSEDVVLVDRPGRGYGDDYTPWLLDDAAPVGELVRARAASITEEGIVGAR